MLNFGPDYQTPKRMELKRQALPPLVYEGKRVLDVGTDHGHWAFAAAAGGADAVVGLDRNRDVRGVGHQNLVAQNNAIARRDARYLKARFEHIDIGKQWFVYGQFDLIFVMSVYHHIYENCGDHVPIWYWLRLHCSPDAEVIYEGPTDDTDPVVRKNVSAHNRKRYTPEAIMEAADPYFTCQHVGPALHEPTRGVWKFKARPAAERITKAFMLAGTGVATKAFEYADGRRIKEIHAATGMLPVAGSLNLRLASPFDWDRGYFRFQMLDVADRSKGLESEWAPRWARLYPLMAGGVLAWAFRFEGERYDYKFMELIAPQRLRDAVAGPLIEIAR